MYAFLQKHSLLTDSQFGFKKQNSCQTALLALTEKMYKAINEGKYFGMTQLDLSKAFDLVYKYYIWCSSGIDPWSIIFYII